MPSDHTNDPQAHRNGNGHVLGVVTLVSASLSPVVVVDR